MKARLNTATLLAITLVPLAGRADAPRGSSYAEDARAGEVRPPTQTLIDAAPTVRLRVDQMPTRMKMRPVARKVVAADEPAEGEGDGEKATVTATASASADSSGVYKKFPTTTRDLRERVAFRIRAGMDLENAPANGETMRGGFELGGNFAETRPFIVADAVVGARGIVTPSLNGYFLGSFVFDASDSLAAETAVIHPSDGQGENLQIKAGYAEWGREDRKPDDQQRYDVWVRAGRQFRLDGGNLFAYFDGATVGYRKPTWNASAFAGQRVALYIDTEPGIVFGATMAADLKNYAPIRVWVDYMGLQIASTDFDLDGNVDDETRHLMEARAAVRLGKTMRLDARARLTGLADVANTEAGEIPETKFALGRAGARLRYDGNRMIVIADVEQRFKDDIAYDLATPAQVDILEFGNKIGTLSTPVDATAFGVRFDWLNQRKTVELVAFGRAELANDTPITTDTKSYFEAGAAIAGVPIGIRGSGVYTTAQYTYRQYTNEGKDGDVRIDGVCNDFTDDNMDGLPDACLAFDDSASSGIDRMHQLAAEAVIATRGEGAKRWRFGAGAFFRVFDFSSPYREVINDARGGGRADVQYWFNRDLHLDVQAEVAQASPTLAREIGLMSAVRAAMEARW